MNEPLIDPDAFNEMFKELMSWRKMVQEVNDSPVTPGRATERKLMRRLAEATGRLAAAYDAAIPPGVVSVSIQPPRREPPPGLVR